VGRNIGRWVLVVILGEKRFRSKECCGVVLGGKRNLYGHPPKTAKDHYFDTLHKFGKPVQQQNSTNKTNTPTRQRIPYLKNDVVKELGV